MRHCLLILSLTLLAASVRGQQPGFTLTGTAEGTTDGDTVYLATLENMYMMRRLDSTVVSNGQFTFRGQQPGCAFRYVIPTHGGKQVAYGSVLLENADISIQVFADSRKESAITSSGPNHQLWQEYKQLGKQWTDELVDNWKLSTDTTATAGARRRAETIVDSLRALQRGEQNAFMLRKLPAAFCDIILGSNFASMDNDEQQQALQRFSRELPDGPNYQRLQKQWDELAPVAVGRQFTDFTMDTPEGQPLKVSDVVGRNKLTLVDFWASWCGPCRAEMPNVVEAYQQYHAQGFEVVGVSLDNKREPWVKAIDDLHMPWPQMSDLKGWQSEGARIYKVRAIPANVLIDGQGRIVARDLRGQRLAQKVGELLR